MADKSDLKAELERKKQRLAQIREEKKRKEEEKKKKERPIRKQKLLQRTLIWTGNGGRLKLCFRALVSHPSPH
ncbi:hypothetical protein DNTS_004276 [Danionella cerebrum]|uniref:Uncharacterized protein n=1 Tax=Danionella cerebrum TaxID=2873325 RepID=A0A553RI27_9TELE|nr:hypothetical protein DNTS_004276 [Danionella translucida]